MKKTLLLILLWSVTYTQAQFWKKKLSGNGQVATETRKVSSYDKITVTGAFKVKIVPGEPGILKVTADENLMEYIETFTKSGKLIIRVNPEFTIRHYSKLAVEVPADYLSRITLTGSGSVFNPDPFDWNNLKLVLTGSGNMEILSDVKHLEATLTGSGNIDLTGKADTAEYVLTGSGDIDAKKLDAQKVKATLTGSGDIYLHAIERLNARIMGSGDIIYYGEPENLKSKTFGSGDIIFRRL